MNKIFKGKPEIFKTRFKSGWTMVELCVALIALAVLVGISIQSLKPKKFLIGPFAYAGIKNLRAANFEIIDKCNKNTGTEYHVFGCEPNQGLPSAPDAVSAMEKFHNEHPDVFVDGEGHPLAVPSEANMDDPYCYEVANTFSLIGDTVNCKYASGNNTNIKLPTGDGKGANAGVPNFQASNMVAYYHIESPWVKIVKGASTEGSEDSFNATDDTDYYKQIFIDVNGDDRPNKIGEDQFPLRIYKLGGEIIPGFCGNGSLASGASNGVYTSEIHPDEASGNYKDRCVAENISPFGNLSNWQETSYPFAYNLYRSYSSEDNPDDRLSSRELLGVSYKEAACKGGRHNMIPREECTRYKNLNPDKYKQDSLYNQEVEYGKDVLKNCTEGEVSAFCVVRIAKPNMPGLFKLPIL